MNRIRVIAALRELAAALEDDRPAVERARPSDFMRETLPTGIGNRMLNVIAPWASRSACWADMAQFDCRKFLNEKGWGRRCHRELLEGLRTRGLALACGCDRYVPFAQLRCARRAAA